MENDRRAVKAEELSRLASLYRCSLGELVPHVEGEQAGLMAELFRAVPELDRDGDDCPNLVEACDGNLYNDLDVWTGNPGTNSTCSRPDRPL